MGDQTQTDTETFVWWHGKPLPTIRDLMDAMGEIYAIADATERQRVADEFVHAYRQFSENADTNLGYLTGYFDKEQMVGMLRLFRVEHPIFGGPELAETITPERALALGAEAMAGSST